MLDFHMIYQREIERLENAILSKCDFSLQIKENVIYRLHSSTFCENSSENYVVLPKPIVLSSGLIRELPVQLHLMKMEVDENFFRKLYHELMHIVSVSQLREIKPGLYQHNWGICYTQYQIAKGQVILLPISRNEIILNEILTNIAAEFFLNLYGYENSTKFKRLLRVMSIQEVSYLNELVLAYISNDFSTVERRILSIFRVDNIEEFKKMVFRL